MKSVLPLCCAALASLAAPAHAELDANSSDARLVRYCEAHLDTMTERKVAVVRRQEFALRIALAPFAAGGEGLSDTDVRLAQDDLARARQTLASSCGMPLEWVSR